MDKIYSRRRFVIPKIRNTGRLWGRGKSWNNNYKNNISDLRNKKLIKFIIIIIIAIIIANNIISTINPIIIPTNTIKIIIFKIIKISTFSFLTFSKEFRKSSRHVSGSPYAFKNVLVIEFTPSPPSWSWIPSDEL